MNFVFYIVLVSFIQLNERIIMKNKQIISRKFSFDAAHRIVNHKAACGNVHGHLYFGDLIFSFNSSTMEDPELGYAMDFSEIKRIGIQFINDYFDHAYIANPLDYMVPVLKENNSKLWTMSLNGTDFCNPSVENMAKELFLCIDELFENRGVKLEKIIMYETPNSYTECTPDSITPDESLHFFRLRHNFLTQYAAEKGIITYNKNNQ